MNKKALQIGFGIVILGIVCWYLASTIQVDVVVAILSSANLTPLFLAVPVVLLSHVVRATRWRRLIAHTQQRVGLGAVFNSVMIGYASNTIIPRSGEFLRPLILTRRTSLSYTALLSSVVVERVLDVLSLLIAITVVIIVRNDVVQQALPGFSTLQIVLSIAAPLILLAGLIWIIAFTRYGSVFVARLVRPLSTKLASMLDKIISDVAVGAGALRSGSGWVMISLETALIWVLYAVPVWMALNAFPWAGSGYAFSDAWILLVIIAVGVTIAPTPGALGVYQAFSQLALVRLFGVTPDEGMSFGIASWVLNYGSAMIVGGICFVIDRMTNAEKPTAAP